MGWRDVWVNVLHSAATSSKTTRTLLTPLGVAVFGVFTTGFVVAAIVVDKWADLPGVLPEGLRFGVSIPVLVLGVIAIVWSVAHFLKARGTPVPFNPPPELVKTGPYRYVRNPMLTGVFVMLFGVGLFINSFSLVCVFTPLFVLANIWELKAIEEPELTRRLGEPYVEYRANTPMFIPRRRSPINQQRRTPSSHEPQL